VVGIVISGFGLSAFIFSNLSSLLFPGNTSEFLLTLALGTSIPMVIGFFLVRPIPLPSHDSTHVVDRDASGQYQALPSSDDPILHGINSQTCLLIGDSDPEDSPFTSPPRRSVSRSFGHAVAESVELSPSRSLNGLHASSRRWSSSTASRLNAAEQEKPLEGRGVDLTGRDLWVTMDFWLMFSINVLCKNDA
jgi:hypothetical protein